jgi:nucleoside recognition membrane protein YjiH
MKASPRLTRFVVPAALGAMIFLGPVQTHGMQTVVFGMLVTGLREWLEPVLLSVLLLITGAAAFGALLCVLGAWRPRKAGYADQLFAVGWGWMLLRLAGFLVVAAVAFEAGPQWIRLPDTGGTVVRDIGMNVVVIYFAGLLLMPLLTDYGLMEFAGTLARPAFRRAFRLPGRAAIDTLTSLASASAIGLLLTINQYRRGTYDAREAAIIACNFSIVAIPFCLLIAQVSRIEHLFFGWYLSVLTVCLICAAILARIPPLSRIPRTRLAPEPVAEQADAGVGLWRHALATATERAARGPGPRQYLREFARTFVNTSCGVIGPCMCVATAATLLIFHTPVVDALVTPLRLLLEVLAPEEAAQIAPALVAGFGDQFLPALIAARSDDEFWRFVLAGLAVTQLVFMSEFGMIVLRSPLPISLGMLAGLFVLRTLITLPMLLICAWWLVPAAG